MRRLASALLLAMAALAGGIPLAGCGYQAGLLIPADVHSVSVRMVRNETFWHEAMKVDNLEPAAALSAPRPAYTMEVELSERLKNEIVRRTPLRLVDEDRADSLLTASIVRVEPKVLLRDAQDNVLAQRVDVRVDFTWRDRRSGRVLAEGKGIARPTDFLTARGETFTTAARESFDYIAQMIVERMQEGF